jgi:hypothetical protein
MNAWAMVLAAEMRGHEAWEKPQEGTRARKGRSEGRALNGRSVGGTLVGTKIGRSSSRRNEEEELRESTQECEKLGKVDALTQKMKDN